MRNPFVRRRLSPKPFTHRRLGVDRLEDRLTPSTTFTVNSLLDTASPPAGVTTLRSAIAAANADNNTDPAHPDVINFSADGTIALGSELPPIIGSLFIQGPGAGNLTVLGQNQVGGQTILTVNSPATATLSGLTVDGNASHNSGISVAAGGSLIVTDAVIQHTYAPGDGGGIADIGGTVTVARSQFLNDIAGAGGGIANVGGTVAVSQTTFDNCYAITSDGGGILNWAGSSGTGGDLTVVGCTFSNDFATNLGGGIALDAGSRATVADSTFSNDQASDGGAISLHISRYNPIYTVGLVLAGSTVAGNTAFTGGGLFVEPNTGILVFTATLEDTIVARNVGGDVSGALDPAGDHDLIGDGSGMIGLTNSVNSNKVGTTASPINPLLGPLADNGGPTKTMALLPGSPAIDSGSNPANLANDQRGFARVHGPAVDIGAFEVQAPPTIQAVAVNGGTAQRSEVTSITATFSTQVAFAASPAAAFALTRVSDGATVSFTATVNTVMGETVVTLSEFTGAATQFDSLADGRYTLRVLAGQVTANGFTLDGNNDGTAGDGYTSPADTFGGHGLHLYRLFGDANGDGVVDATDLGQFRSTFNSNNTQSNYLSYLDANGDGVVDAIDLGQFRARVNANVFG